MNPRLILHYVLLVLTGLAFGVAINAARADNYRVLGQAVVVGAITLAVMIAASRHTPKTPDSSR